MSDEINKLQARIRKFTCEDVMNLTLGGLNQLEDQLEYSLDKVRTRKVLTEPDTNRTK